MTAAFWPMLGAAFGIGVMCGFAIWEAVDRSKWAAYRAIYRRMKP